MNPHSSLIGAYTTVWLLFEYFVLFPHVRYLFNITRVAYDHAGPPHILRETVDFSTRLYAEARSTGRFYDPVRTIFAFF